MRWLGKPSILLLYCVWQPAIIVLAIHNCCAYLDYNVPLCSHGEKRERPRRRLGTTKKQNLSWRTIYIQKTFKESHPNSSLDFYEWQSKWHKSTVGNNPKIIKDSNFLPERFPFKISFHYEQFLALEKHEKRNVTSLLPVFIVAAAKYWRSSNDPSMKRLYHPCIVRKSWETNQQAWKKASQKY